MSTTRTMLCADGKTRPVARGLVAGRLSMRAMELPPAVLERVRKDIAFPNPDYQRRKMLDLYIPGDMEPRLAPIEEIGTEVYLPRGAVGALRKRLEEAGVVGVFEDHREQGHEITTTGLHGPKSTLRPYQEEALDAIVTQVQGHVVIPCGGGKTTLGAAAIDRIQRSTLILIHTDDLADQWDATCRELLDIDPVRISRATVQLGAINIANVKTLALLKEERHPLWALLTENIGFIIVDEAHHTPAKTFRDVIEGFPARRRIGLTATPDREDGYGPLIELVFGPRLFEISVEELLALRFLVAPTVEEVRTAFRFDYNEPKDLPALDQALVHDEPRNRQIVDLGARLVGDGKHVLVLAKHVEHVELLAVMLQDAGCAAAYAHGQVSKKKRAETIEAWKRGEHRLLVANVIADEGLDVPSLDALILAYPAKAGGPTMQRVGRIMRPHTGPDGALKTPELYDVVDPLVEILWKRAGKRMAVFRRVDKTLARRRKRA